MYLFKNYRIYIPLISIIFCFVFFYIYLNIEQYIWNLWLEILIVIIPFIFVPVSNIISMVLNTHKIKHGRKLYISILFSYALQIFPACILLMGTDDKVMGIIVGYYLFIFVIDAISFIYPWKVYTNRK